MSTLDEILKMVNPGSLNAYSLERFTLKKDRYNLNNLSSFREAMSEIYSDALDRTPDGPYRAVCLAVTQDKLTKIPGVDIGTLQNKLSTEQQGGYLVSVVARIEELHSAIPKPLKTGVQKLSCINFQNAALLLHPIFYGVGESAGPLPKPGNIVMVDFHNKNDRSYGIYMGIADNSVEADEPSEASPEEVSKDGPEERLGDT